MKDISHFHCYPITNEDLTQDMGTHLYDSFHSLERILEGNQETRKEVLTMFGGHVEFNGCKTVTVLMVVDFVSLIFFIYQFECNQSL